MTTPREKLADEADLALFRVRLRIEEMSDGSAVRREKDTLRDVLRHPEGCAKPFALADERRRLEAHSLMPITDANKAEIHRRRDKHNAEMRQLLEMGLISRMPGRLRNGETILSAANKELDRMIEEDNQLQALREAGDPDAMQAKSNAEMWSDIHIDSLRVFKKIVSANIPFDEDHIKLIREQREAGSKVLGISAKLAVEKFKGQRVGAVAVLLERMAKLDAGQTIEGKPAVSFDDEKPWSMEK